MKNKIKTRITGMLLTLVLMLLIITLFSQTVFALSVSQPIHAGELSGVNDFTVLIINDANAKDIVLSITSRSKYLENYVTISPKYVSLSPYEKKYINVKIDLPSDMSPGDHELIILPNIGATHDSGVNVISASTISIRFTSPGSVSKQVTLNDFVVSQNGNVEFKLSAENTGNVRVTAIPYVEIRKYGNHLRLLKGTTQHLLDSSEIKQMQINENLQPGTYEALAYVKFDGTDSNKITKLFTIADEEEPQDNDNGETGGGGGGGFGGVSGSIGNGDSTWPDWETIDIGDVEEEDKIKLQAEEVKIKITDFNAIIHNNNLSIKLKIENTGNLTVYIIKFMLVDDNENIVKTLTDTGNISGTAEIRKDIDISDIETGKYVLKIEFSYADKTLEKTLQINIPSEPLNSITGLVTAEPGYSVYIILIVIIVIIALIVKMKYFNKKRENYHDLYKIKKIVQYKDEENY